MNNNLHRRAKEKNFFFSIARSLAAVVLCVAWSTNASAQLTQFSVGQASIPARSAPAMPSDPSTYTSIQFDAFFASAPNVFLMDTVENPDPCSLRIRNVTNMGFEITCLEPINEDRATTAITFDYIAVQDGGVTVDVNGGGQVEFASACTEINNQVYGPQCDDCSGPQGFVQVNFPSAFGSTPALLTEIQTTNNLNNGEALFIDPAIQTGSLDASGFDLAIDQLEAGLGPLANDERVCYLAVEQNGCQDLDLTSVSPAGPASVFFQAINTPQTLDGFGNGCNAGEGATFAGGSCFTNTPIAVAEMITRRGNNGGFVRRCLLNSSEIRLTIDEDRVSNGERNHIDEVASVLAFSTTFTTPVTLAQASVEATSRGARFHWETAAESFHLGFNLWGEFQGDWIQLNNALVASNGRDSQKSRQYQREVRLSRAERRAITRFGLSSVDTSGYEEFYGPFTLGEQYGQASLSEPIDWTQTSEEFARSMRARGYTKVGNRWRKLNAKRENRIANRQSSLDRWVIDIETQQVGIHAVTFEEISALTNKFTGVLLKRLAITLQGNKVARYIDSANDRFDSGDTLYFAVNPIAGGDNAFLRHYTYQLILDNSRALDATQWGGAEVSNSSVSDNVWLQQSLTSIRAYSAFLPEADPWYDSQIFAVGAPSSQTYEFSLPPEASLEQGAKISIKLHGGVQFGGGNPDHHVQVSVNGTLMADVLFDGFTTELISLDLAAEQLNLGTNSVQITLPADTGFFGDIVLVDEIKVLHAQPHDPGLSAMAATDSVDFYLLDAQIPVEELAFAYTPAGDLSRLMLAEEEQDTFMPQLPISEARDVVYELAGNDGWATPSRLEVRLPRPLHETQANFIVVSHAAFLGEELENYIAGRASANIEPAIFDWADIVAAYGYGNETPAALDHFLRRIDAQGQVDYVLLVGGHTSDFLGITDPSIINFIPTHYRKVGDFSSTPTDNPFVDFDKDGLPDAAVGRWPVRSSSDLQNIINKSKRWSNLRAQNQSQSAILVAQTPDGRDLSFNEQFEIRVIPHLDTSNGFEEVDTLYLSELAVSDPINEAREQMTAAINNGVDLISFNGHGSPVGWGFQGIVDTAFISSLTNSDPLAVMPLACYTTYYQSTDVNTLAHQWLFAGDQGAAVVHGAAVLGEYRENAIFTERFLIASKESKTFGEAIKRAKIASGIGNQMIQNWAYLGDPTLALKYSAE
ncbi:MAG: C25 family cysteine peptidase [Pseudomonadota bacterium]